MQATARDVRPEVGDLVADVFGFDGVVTAEMSRSDIPKWDSLRHVALVNAIEQQFGVSLSMDEMIEIRSVRDVETILERHGV